MNMSYVNMNAEPLCCLLSQTFLGNRYGYQTFPNKIESQEFETLVESARELELRDADLLTVWFLRDDNNVPAVYILQVRD